MSISDAKTILRVGVSVGFPLGELIKASQPTGSTPFGRCVLVFPIQGSPFPEHVLPNICQYVRDWNADCLSLTKEDKLQVAVMNQLLMYPPLSATS